MQAEDAMQAKDIVRAMYAMQYEITLPVDYDMAIIRRRVAAKGPALDDCPGLGLKAYLVRERGRDGSPVNQYAPFYLWTSPAGMGAFLWGGGGFGGLVAAFGRPAVRHWTGAAFALGPAADAAPTVAVRRVRSVPPDVDPAEAVAAAKGEALAAARGAGVHSVGLAVDPLTWQIVRIVLGQEVLLENEAAPESEDMPVSGPGPVGGSGGAVVYRVLHLSKPGLRALAT